MKNRQLFYLFFCNFVIFFIGWGLVPLLPLYAAQFGANATMAGAYLAIIYLAIAAGTMLTGWLAKRLPPKGLFIGVGALGALMLVLHRQVSTLWQAMLLTSMVWFCAGVGTALISVFTGLYADTTRRGKSFSLMFLASPLAALIGSLTVGQLVAWQGYPFMFVVLSIVGAGWPAAGLLGLEDRPLSVPAPAAKAAGGASLQLGPAFYMLLLMVFLSATTVYISRLGTSLSMQTLNFSPGAIASTMAIGGLVTIPATLWFGTLSDRFGRKRILMVTCLLAVGGVLILSAATRLWQFWLASVLLFMAKYANGSLAAALATDLLAPEHLSRGLPWLNAMAWVAAIAGFASTGYLMDRLGAPMLYLIGAALSILAAALLGLLPCRPQTLWPLPLRWRVAK